jgi:hypothetical protein
MEEIYPILVNSSIVSSTASLGKVDLEYYFASPGRRNLMATLAVAAPATGAGDTFTLAVKMQESVDTTSADYTDITNGGFVAVTSGLMPLVETVYFAVKATTRYIRAYATMTTSSAKANVAIEAFTVKREA